MYDNIQLDAKISVINLGERKIQHQLTIINTKDKIYCFKDSLLHLDTVHHIPFYIYGTSIIPCHTHDIATHSPRMLCLEPEASASSPPITLNAFCAIHSAPPGVYNLSYRGSYDIYSAEDDHSLLGFSRLIGSQSFTLSEKTDDDIDLFCSC